SGVRQRRRRVQSQTPKTKADHRQPQLEKLENPHNPQMKKLTHRVYACKPEALEALKQYQEGLEEHQLTQVSQETVRA
ncbi:MAG: IS1634 family transposase, partial [Limnospira sp. PMC 1254.20]|nr:IS1634 family transposase [Limnospira sp. PMC 1254.20]